MARSKQRFSSSNRSSRSRGFQRKPRPDWVFNQESYSPLTDDLAAGPANALAIELYASTNTRRQMKWGQTNFLGTNAATGASTLVAGQWEFAEGKRPVIHAMMGHKLWVPTTWTLGTALVIGYRLMVIEQDSLTGSAILDANYSMWVSNNTLAAPTERWANEKRVLKEWRLTTTFDSSVASPIMHHRFHWRGRWRLRPEEGLFLYMESQPGSATVRGTNWLKTLVEDDST